ncbi:type III pantothenate kinase [Methylotenera sp. 1P/1]|uniref:type III pantothenate kinase n=1 Tax=Methylotenera sp. 1P/1 TaxID=1131551 RepID=UPI000377E6A7|nr:type III pantothenate kinase [Methylotenera sp. 1P/1]
MILLVDVGNTRTKWVLAENNHMLTEIDVCLNQDVASSTIASLAEVVHKVSIANVAGDAMAQTLAEVMQAVDAPVTMVQTSHEACGVRNGYDYPQALGVDRWVSLIAAYDKQKASCLVINAGTAVTIDALSVPKAADHANFMGGVIMPGVGVMLNTLAEKTAQLNVMDGSVMDFPTNTQDAMHTGCLAAVIGVVQRQWQLLQALDQQAPAILLSGGDAELLAKHLPADLAEKTIIVDNLVLRGLMRMEREMA